MTAAVVVELKHTAPKIDGKYEKQLANATAIINQGATIADSFLASYKALGGKGDSEQEQDLLRAMLVFSCSALDAVVKQLIRDSLDAVIDLNQGAHREFQKFVERRLRKGADADTQDRPTQSFDANLLATVLVSNNPRNELIAILKDTLVSDSLQSRDQLLRAAAQFAITKDEVLPDDALVRAAFKARNQIIHEMDVDIGHDKRRRQRSAGDMVSYTESALDTAVRFILMVQKRLNAE